MNQSAKETHPDFTQENDSETQATETEENASKVNQQP
jgi:hypothetical protein